MLLRIERGKGFITSGILTVYWFLVCTASSVGYFARIVKQVGNICIMLSRGLKVILHFCFKTLVVSINRNIHLDMNRENMCTESDKINSLFLEDYILITNMNLSSIWSSVKS